MSVYMVCTMGTLLKPKYYVLYDCAKSTNFVHGASSRYLSLSALYSSSEADDVRASTLLLSSLLLVLERAEGGNFWPRKQHFDSTVNF